MCSSDLKEQLTPRPKEETAAQVIARLPVGDVTRVYRDTLDPSVQAEVAAQRKLIGKWETAYEDAYAAEDERGMEMALHNIENAYNRTYEILNNAPLKKEVQITEQQLRQQKDYEDKQYNTVQVLTKLFEEKTGAKLKLAERKVEGVVRVKSGRPTTAIKEPSLAQQEAQFKKEQAVGEYAAKTLEDLAKVRAQLKEVTDRIAYIDAHKAEPRTPARMKQNVARSQAVAERTRLEGEERRLSAMQKAVEREAKEERKAVKAVRTEKTRMVREAGRLQEAIETDEGLAAPVREEGGTPISAETYRQLLDGSIVRAVNDVAENSEVPLLKATASKVKDFILRTKFKFVPEITHEGKKVAALYDPASNTVYMTPEGRTQEDLIHEATHAATMRALTMPDADLSAEQRTAKQELQNMYDAMLKDKRFADAYAAKN